MGHKVHTFSLHILQLLSLPSLLSSTSRSSFKALSFRVYSSSGNFSSVDEIIPVAARRAKGKARHEPNRTRPDIRWHAFAFAETKWYVALSLSRTPYNKV